MDIAPSRTTVHGEQVHRVKILGTGAADPTLQIGQRVVVTRTATGVYRIQWPTDDSPGTFVGPIAPSFHATTAADLKGYTAVYGEYDTANHRIAVSVFNSSFAAADLAALQHLTMGFVFADTQSP